MTARRPYLRKQEAVRPQHAWRCWQGIQPTTRRCLERVAAVGGETLAEQVAEAIRRERERSSVPEDRRHHS